MRKIVLSFFAILMCCFLAVAQNQRVSGTVSDNAGSPVVGATVQIKGTGVGVATGYDGKYSINAPADGTLTFSFIGMKSTEIAIAGKTTVNAVLANDDTVIDDVVVTALGISRSEKSLGYAVQSVSSDDLTKAREGNVINSLAGKVAGVNITATSGTAGGSSKIVIRGQSSLGDSGQPLFIVDGLPVSNQSYNPTGLDGSVDVGNRMGDIAGDDIESINVLKGAAATALYGARAKDGAIVITTKKGSKNQKTFVTINSSLRIETPLRMPNLQNEYAAGNGLTGEYKATSWNGWGPKMDGQQVQNFLGQDVTLQAYPDNVKDFFNTGTTWINSVSVSGGDEKSDFRLGVTAHNQEGIIPGNEYNKYNVTFNGGRDFSEKVSARVSFTYLRTDSDGRPAQGSNDTNVLMPTVYTMPRNMDINWLRDNWQTEDGKQQAINTTNNSNGNMYWNINKNKFSNLVDRVYGSAIITYKPFKNLTVTNNAGTDWFREERRQINAWGTIGAQDGGFSTYDIYNRSFNNDLIATYDAKMGDFGLKVMAGNNLRQAEAKVLTVSAQNLLVADVYSYSNAKVVTPTNTKSMSRLVGVYGEIDLSYKDFAFLSITGRNDWSSTMPKNHKSYFYPSVSGSFVFTELLPKNNVLSFGKLRASWANVGSDTSPYQLDFLYYPIDEIWGQYGLSGTMPHGGLLGYEGASTYPDPTLQPQNQSSFEIGADLRFFNGRIRLDGNYYYSKTTNNIVRLDVANSTGYFYMRRNAGAIENQGIELMLGVTPVQTKNFAWDMDFNFASNKQKVAELDPSISSYNLASGYNSLQIKAEVGEPFSLYGTYWVTDDNGNYIIKSNGTRQISSSTKNLGKVAPDFTLGISNTFSYKGFSLSALIDIRQGGKMFAGTVSQLRTGGTAKETTDGGRATIVDKGVMSDGTENTTEISAYTFWINNYSTSCTEANVFDASYVKLREIAFSWRLPEKWLDKTFLGGVSVGFEGRNLWLISSDCPHIDPEASTFGPSSTGSGVEYASIPSTRSLGFNIKLTF